MVKIKGYHLNEQLYNGSRTLVYRAIRDSDQKPVVIKLLKNTYPNFNELLQFRNQYTISKNLDIPGIIRPYSLEAYQNSYALVMEDFGGVSLREYIQTSSIGTLSVKFLEGILVIAVQITDILHNVHQNRVIHKDIKPDNILINPETKQIKLIDFSIASLLPKETQEITNPNSLEGTLAYISPEQTGRMNRGVDYRSDFYALGVSFYELLTGELPFKSEDAMELVHCHIAQQPPTMKKPHPNRLRSREREKEIPQVLSDIVMKLMAKNAEDRYQSALGLKHDLEICLKKLNETGKIEYFQIAQWDICDRFIIPEKLYGREKEIEELLAAFERVSQGNSELILVAGFSGIGKTAVVNEAHKPIVKQRGYFIKGKFDQFNRNIPFSAFVQAFRDLMGQLFSESDAQLSRWRHNILQALGNNAQVIIDVIPELEKIIGKQPPLPELSGTAAQNRFNLLFQKFIQVFTTKEHPLVIFLDDLQWADSASNKLMQLLMSESENGYLLLIGAYRDNEVFPAHPLMLSLEEIRKSQGLINTIILAPLTEDILNHLVADTLNCSLSISQPLTELIYQKTQGNPFFSTQFLKSLYEDNLIKFDFNISSWICNISQLKALALTDDVVAFMALKLQKLTQETHNLLKLAACIGNQFDLATLAVVCEKSEAETATDLWEALQEGFILPQSEVYKFYIESDTQFRQDLKDEQIVNYKFLHDRVQQAAYSLISEDKKQSEHLKIGKLLLNYVSEPDKTEKIFEIVNHLNRGIELINLSSSRNELAQLNLIAARKAIVSTAYVGADEYLRVAMSLLSSDCWNSQKDKIAATYMQEAYYCYARWGAKAKIDDLEKRYPDILAAILETQKNNSKNHDTYLQTNQTIQISRSSSGVCDTLDFASILKATQALSKEIELEELISTLLQIVIENAGAEKAALVFLKNDILNLEAVASKDNGVTHLSIPYETSSDIPNTVINYVKRSLKTVVLDNAQVQNDFITDEYLIKQQPYSLLCAPILNKGKLTGLLYLENKLTIGAFTWERLEIINLLCTQAAISLENARLHRQEKEKSDQLEQSQQRLKLIIHQTPVAVIEWDTAFKFQSWNPAAEKIFGYHTHEILGHHLRYIVPEEYHAYVDDVATQILSQSGGSHAINENVTKDNRRITCEWFNAPMFNSNGEVCGAVSMTLDISHRKQAETAVIQKSQELEKALQELNQAQLQMVQNEKMATLGNLVAGVAHEVNNPIGFLKGSISNAQEYIQDLFAHIECYQANYPNPGEEVIENAEEIDLEYLTEDLPKLLNSMEVATERITDISNSLRTFSRADTAEKVACNIHEGIDSTILILKYRLKADDKRPAIEVIKEYGKLPSVKCFLGQLNQVFMNIIANAIDALDMTNEEKTFAEIQENPHKITINTEISTVRNTVLISIKDNGTGMPESIRERIFDNLFTTKGVGKGTGLGLAIAKQIVEETHNGKISCNSTLGKGTEFVIELPTNEF
ncbi:MAG: AAA family ATPase [Rivularia sp. (in: cyanobacteria)]